MPMDAVLGKVHPKPKELGGLVFLGREGPDEVVWEKAKKERKKRREVKGSRKRREEEGGKEKLIKRLDQGLVCVGSEQASTCRGSVDD